MPDHPLPLPPDPRDPYHHTRAALHRLLRDIPFTPHPASSYQLGNNAARHRAQALLAKIKAGSTTPTLAQDELARLLAYAEITGLRKPRKRKDIGGVRPGETLPGMGSYTGDLFAAP